MNEIKELIERLRYYNKWRRGGEGDMPEPKQIGEDIEAAIRLLDGLCEQKEMTKNEQRSL